MLVKTTFRRHLMGKILLRERERLWTHTHTHTHKHTHTIHTQTQTHTHTHTHTHTPPTTSAAVRCVSIQIHPHVFKLFSVRTFYPYIYSYPRPIKTAVGEGLLCFAPLAIRRAGGRAGRQAGRQADRQRDRQTEISNWVRGLSAPMHLGLNRRALCVPYRIMGAVAPKLKFLMTSWSKKGTQIYYFFSLKSPSKRTPSRFPSGAPMERDTRLQGICISLKDLIKIPLMRRPQERNAIHVPRKWGPYGNRRPFPSLA